ncbi:hypothetical protein, partial [Escherichia coli]|uniref:hypothetical protein n=1 Tax=Escherichia coli TaxID=562 RepID=UPI001AA0F991
SYLFACSLIPLRFGFLLAVLKKEAIINTKKNIKLSIVSPFKMFDSCLLFVLSYRVDSECFHMSFGIPQ